MYICSPDFGEIREGRSVEALPVSRSLLIINKLSTDHDAESSRSEVMYVVRLATKFSAIEN